MFDCKVLVVGDIILDRFVYGNARRIAPEAPVPIVNMSSETHFLGGAANVAANMASLGCEVSLVGAIGNDAEGVIVQSLLDDSNIDSHLITSGVTTLKTRVISDDQYVVRVDRETREDHQLEIPDIKYDAVMISDYAKGAINPSTMADLSGHRIYIDPKPRNKKLYQSAYMMFPNKYEAAEMLGSEKDYPELVLELKNRFGLSAAIITLSEDGLILATEEDEVQQIPAYKLAVVERSHKMDVTGAGDTLFSVFVASQCSGNDFLRSASLANVAAAIAVNKIGTSICSWEEIKHEIESQEIRYA